MARVVGGIGASHAPSMEHIYDAGEEVRESDEWQPLFGPFKDVARGSKGSGPTVWSWSTTTTWMSSS